MRLVICDDYRLLLDALGAALCARGYLLEALVTTADDAVHAVLTHDPDVAIIDVHLADGDGLVAASEIAQRHPRTRVLLMSASTDPDILRAGIEAGAAGFARKDDSVDGIVRRLPGGRGRGSLRPRCPPHGREPANRPVAGASAAATVEPARARGARPPRGRAGHRRHRELVAHRRQHGPHPRPERAGEGGCPLAPTGGRDRRPAWDPRPAALIPRAKGSPGSAPKAHAARGQDGGRQLATASDVGALHAAGGFGSARVNATWTHARRPHPPRRGQQTLTESLAELLEAEPDLHVVGVTTSLPRALASSGWVDAHVALLDSDLVGDEGADLARTIRQAVGSRPRIVLLADQVMSRTVVCRSVLAARRLRLGGQVARARAPPRRGPGRRSR